jgi:L-asparaginase II
MSKIETFITRGKITESVHESKCIIKDYNYQTIFTTNHDGNLVYPRSAIKIFQAVPFIKSQAYKKYNLTKKQIAISSASHFGEPEHLKVLRDWIKKIKINKKLLRCGIHNPLHKKSSDQLLLSGKKPDQLHNNCAGKHLGMISGCLMHKFNLNDYLNIKHPYQKLIRDSLEYFTESKINKIQKGIDGCSAPQYAFSLNNLSISMINLLKNYEEEENYTKEIKLLIDSIAKYPQLTGSKSIYSSQLMMATGGKIFSKVGAEGVLLFAHKEKKIGGIIKVKDGNERALPSATNEILKKLKILNKKECLKLSNWSNEKIYNHANIKVGEIYTKIK